MMSYGSLHSRMEEDPDVTESTVLHSDANEQNYPLDYSVNNSGAGDDSHCEGGEKIADLAIEGTLNSSGNSHYKPSKSRHAQEGQGINLVQLSEGCDHKFAETPNEKLTRTNTAYWPFMCNKKDDASHLNGHPYGHSHYHRQGRPVADYEQTLESCDYTLAKTPKGEIPTTGAAQRSYKYDDAPHVNSHTGQRPSTCEACDYSSACSSHWKRPKVTRTEKELEDGKHWGCAVCNFTSSNKRNLKTHVETHSQETPFSCKVCDYYFASASALERHLSGHRYDPGKEQKVPNPSTEDVTNSSKDHYAANHHLQKHTGADCEQGSGGCDYSSAGTFDAKSCLNTDSGRIPCVQEKTSHAAMKRLERTSVGKKQRVGDTLSYTSNISDHLKVHQTGVQSFPCALCSFRTNKQQNLWNHVELHFMETPFPCKVCRNLYFENASALEAHLRSHHYNGNRGSAATNPSILDGSKASSTYDHLSSNSHVPKLPGAVCQKPPALNNDTSVEASHVKVYQKTDSGYMPYEIHDRTHAPMKSLKRDTDVKKSNTFDPCFPSFTSMEKPFSCGLCIFKTSNEWSLKNHMKTHSKETPFSCKVCKYYFTSANTLEVHSRSHPWIDTEGQNRILRNPSVEDEANSKSNSDNPSRNARHVHSRADSLKIPDGCDYTLAETPNEKFLKTNAAYMPFIYDMYDNASHVSSRLYASSNSHYPHLLPRAEPQKLPKGCDYTSAEAPDMRDVPKTDAGKRLVMHEMQNTYTNAYSTKILGRTNAGMDTYPCDADAQKITFPSPSKCMEEKSSNLSDSLHHTSGYSHHQMVHLGVDWKEPRECCDYTSPEASDVSTLLQKTDATLRPLTDNIHGATLASKNTHTEKRKLTSEANGHAYALTNAPESSLRSHTVELPFSVTNDSDLKSPNHDGAKNHPCQVCDYTFADASALEAHARCHTEETPGFAPEAHGDSSSHTSDLRTMEGHIEGRTHTCDVCDHTLASSTSLKRHLLIHAGEKPFTCEVCGHRCRQKFNLKVHMKIHLKNREISELGDCISRDTSTSESHTQIDSEPKTFVCEVCAYTSADASDLESHFRNHTNDEPGSVKETCDNEQTRTLTLPVEKKYACGVCDFKTAHSSYLKIHRRTHTGEKPYSCTICDFTSAFAPYLKEHMRIHTGEKPFVCGICDFKTAHQAVLKRHQRVHAGGPFSCTVCDYKCAQGTSFRAHLKTHVDKEPITCHVCGYISTGPSALKDHMKTHTEETLFSCEVCDYKCARESILTAHLKTHNDKKKPVTCYVCGHVSAHSSALTDHIRTHTQETPVSSGAYMQNLNLLEKGHTKKTFPCGVCDYTSTTAGKLERHKKRMKHNIVNVGDKFAEKRRLIYSGCKY